MDLREGSSGARANAEIHDRIGLLLAIGAFGIALVALTIALTNRDFDDHRYDEIRDKWIEADEELDEIRMILAQLGYEKRNGRYILKEAPK